MLSRRKHWQTLRLSPRVKVFPTIKWVIYHNPHESNALVLVTQVRRHVAEKHSQYLFGDSLPASTRQQNSASLSFV